MLITISFRYYSWFACTSHHLNYILRLLFSSPFHLRHHPSPSSWSPCCLVDWILCRKTILLHVSLPVSFLHLLIFVSFALQTSLSVLHFLRLLHSLEFLFIFLLLRSLVVKLKSLLSTDRLFFACYAAETFYSCCLFSVSSHCRLVTLLCHFSRNKETVQRKCLLIPLLLLIRDFPSASSNRHKRVNPLVLYS